MFCFSFVYFPSSLNVIGTLFVIIFAMPLFIAVIVPLSGVYYFVQKLYVSTARQVKRMESISRSPIYTHFGETITGATTVRAYDRVADFITENEHRIDRNQLCYKPSFVASRWLSVRLEFVGNMIIMFASLLAVLSRGTIDAGMVGLSLSYALNVTGALNMLVRNSSDVETNMVSVERIQEYQETPQVTSPPAVRLSLVLVLRVCPLACACHACSSNWSVLYHPVAACPPRLSSPASLGSSLTPPL